MQPPPMIVLASRNNHKVQELAAMLRNEAPLAVVQGLVSFPWVGDVAETADTFEGNAVLKAQGVARALEGRVPANTWVLADDSGLCVDALDGAPGVQSARFAGTHGDDAANNRALCHALEARGVTASAAHYVCVLAVCPLNEHEGVRTFTGRFDVQVCTAARGEGGFGYDPHAWLDGGRRTVAELTPEEKTARSHRGAAFDAFVRWMANV